MSTCQHLSPPLFPTLAPLWGLSLWLPGADVSDLRAPSHQFTAHQQPHSWGPRHTPTPAGQSENAQPGESDPPGLNLRSNTYSPPL